MNEAVSPFIELDGVRVVEYISGIEENDWQMNDSGDLYKTVYAKKVSRALKDDLPFIKLFHKNFDVFSISAIAQNVLKYIIHNLRIGSEEIALHPLYITEWCGLKNARGCYKGISELVSLKVIALKDKRMHTYFINPNIIFNGSRKRIMMKNYRGEFLSTLHKDFKSNVKIDTDNEQKETTVTDGDE